jgi:hypothetical protein
MNDKPKLEPESIKKEVSATLQFTLGQDFDRFSNGSIMLTATNATFVTPDTNEKGSVGVDLGGTVIEVCFGLRSWRINVAALVSAAHDADVEYRKEHAAVQQVFRPGDETESTSTGDHTEQGGPC